MRWGARSAASLRFAAVAGVTALLLALPATSLALTVGNPPAHAGSGFTLAVKGAKGTVSVYLSPARKLAKGDVSLGRLKVKHGKLAIKIASKVKAGSYYVLVCTGSGRRLKCGSSSHKTSVSHTGVSTPTSTGTNTASTSSAGSSSSGGGGSPTKGKEEPKGKEPKEHSKPEEEHPEPGKPVEREIEKGKEGGLTAEGVEGTKYELVYVAEAAEPDTHIKLTPVTSVTGASGQLVGAVDIEPASTIFARDAYLIIRPPGSISESGREAATFSGTGERLHAVPFLTQEEGGGFILPVASGGGYALFTGATITKLVALPHARPASVLTHSFAHPDSVPSGQASYENELAEALQSRPAAQANNELYEEGSALRTEIKDTLESWYEEIELQKIPPGETEDEAAEEAIKELCAWGRAGALLLGDSGEKVIDGEVINKAEGMSKLYGSDWEETKIFEPSRKLIGDAYNRNQEK